MFKRFIASLVCLTFIFSNLQQSYAQDFSVNQLPIPGTMVGVSAPFAPLALKGLVVNPKKPLEFQFIVDTGKGPQDTAAIKDQANQLVKYFLAGLTIPEGDLWVNLSPYEKNRMVPEALGQTDLGRDLLAQDYILKQLTASLIYPEKDLGKEFWSRVYAKAQAQFGTTNVPVNTFNKVWILPDQAQVFENVNAAYVTKSTLKVMLDEDYLALKKHMIASNGTDSIGSQIVREIVIPEITKEVNTGKNFAPLRQIYQALILAKWYKETIQNGLLDALYTNKNKTAGVNLNDPSVKEQIYERYLKAYKKGAFNYIKEDPTPDGQVVPRKYFSGGTFFGNYTVNTHGSAAMISTEGLVATFTVALVAAGTALTLYLKKRNTAIKKEEKIQGSPAYERMFNRYVRALSSKYSDDRISAAKNLGDLGDTRAVEPLIERLKFGAQEEINVALGQLGDKRAIKPLLVYLGYSGYLSAGEALIKLGASKEQLINGYIPALSSFKEARSNAEHRLRELGATNEQMADGYIAALSSPRSTDAQNNAIEKLGDLGNKRAVDPLIRMFKKIPWDPKIQTALIKLGRGDFISQWRLVEKRAEHLIREKASELQNYNINPGYVAMAAVLLEKDGDFRVKTEYYPVKEVTYESGGMQSYGTEGGGYSIQILPLDAAMLRRTVVASLGKALGLAGVTKVAGPISALAQTEKSKDGEDFVLASMHDDRKTMEVLLSRGVNVNSIDDHGITALMWACWHASKENVELLITKGADVNAVDGYGRIVLSYARNALDRTLQINRQEIVKILTIAGAKENPFPAKEIIKRIKSKRMGFDAGIVLLYKMLDDKDAFSYVQHYVGGVISNEWLSKQYYGGSATIFEDPGYSEAVRGIQNGILSFFETHHDPDAVITIYRNMNHNFKRAFLYLLNQDADSIRKLLPGYNYNYSALVGGKTNYLYQYYSDDEYQHLYDNAPDQDFRFLIKKLWDTKKLVKIDHAMLYTTKRNAQKDAAMSGKKLTWAAVTAAVAGGIWAYNTDFFQVQSPFIDVAPEFAQREYFYPKGFQGDDGSTALLPKRIVVEDINGKLENGGWSLEINHLSLPMEFRFKLVNKLSSAQKINTVLFVAYGESGGVLKSWQQTPVGRFASIDPEQFMDLTLPVQDYEAVRQVSVTVITEDQSAYVFTLVGVNKLSGVDQAMNTAGQNPSGEANANLGPIRERIKNDFNEGRIKKGTIIEITLKEGEPFQIKFSHFDNDLYPMFIYQLKEPGSQRAHDLLEIFEIRDYRVIATNPAGASAAMITLLGTVKWYIKRLNSKDGMTVISAADNLGANGGSEALVALESKLKETSTTLISSLTVDQEGKRYDSPVYKRIKQAIALIKIRLDLKKQRGSIITDRVVNRIEYGARQDNGGHDDSWKEAHYYNSSGVLILSETLWAQAIDHPTYDVGDTIPDHAMLKTPVHQDKASAAEKGGIDLNQINVLRKGRTVNVHFDPAQLNELEQGGFEGFTPEITGFQYIKSPFPLLGINTPKETMQLAKA